MWTAPPITLTDEERAELSRRVAAPKTPVCAAKRARIILLAADGVPSRRISAIVGMHESNVAKWRNRWRTHGARDLGGPPAATRHANTDRFQASPAGSVYGKEQHVPIGAERPTPDR